MHLRPTVIATAHSQHSGDIKVVDGLGFRHLSTDSIQHSGGIVTEIWSNALKPYGLKAKTWLILGVAGGSVINLISKKYQPSKIVGIDIDPIIVDLGKQYFGLSKITNLKIIIGDANDYLQKTNDLYDFVIVDLFGRDSCPSFVYTSKFLKKLYLTGHHIIINHLFHTPNAQNAAQKLESVLTKLKIPFATKQILKNKIYILKNV